MKWEVINFNTGETIAMQEKGLLINTIKNVFVSTDIIKIRRYDSQVFNGTVSQLSKESIV